MSSDRWQTTNSGYGSARASPGKILHRAAPPQYTGVSSGYAEHRRPAPAHHPYYSRQQAGPRDAGDGMAQARVGVASSTGGYGGSYGGSPGGARAGVARDTRGTMEGYPRESRGGYTDTSGTGAEGRRTRTHTQPQHYRGGPVHTLSTSVTSGARPSPSAPARGYGERQQASPYRQAPPAAHEPRTTHHEQRAPHSNLRGEDWDVLGIQPERPQVERRGQVPPHLNRKFEQRRKAKPTFGLTQADETTSFFMSERERLEHAPLTNIAKEDQARRKQLRESKIRSMGQSRAQYMSSVFSADEAASAREQQRLRAIAQQRARYMEHLSGQRRYQKGWG